MTIDLGAGNLYSISNKLLAMKPPNGEYPTPLRSPALPSSRSIFGARDERRTDVLRIPRSAFSGIAGRHERWRAGAGERRDLPYRVLTLRVRCRDPHREVYPRGQETELGNSDKQYGYP